ncbi:MAG: hypothetical protein LBQ97_04100 [Fusobacteriaceae bacterium]|jgi:hypothetical protein|nr:hypothetical protein [Fusobacteriaceae bacterium]
MNFYIKLIIKILEKTSSGAESLILEKLKSGKDLDASEKEELEQLIDNI